MKNTQCELEGPSVIFVKHTGTSLTSASRFGIGIRDSNRPQFASGYLLFSLALAHGAIYGVDTVDDLAQFDLSNGEIHLRWKEEYLDKPVLRHATADGPQETPLTKQKFCSCLRQIFNAAGYFGELATIHCIRRGLGGKIESKPLTPQNKIDRHPREIFILSSLQREMALHLSVKLWGIGAQAPFRSIIKPTVPP